MLGAALAGPVEQCFGDDLTLWSAEVHLLGAAGHRSEEGRKLLPVTQADAGVTPADLSKTQKRHHCHWHQSREKLEIILQGK